MVNMGLFSKTPKAIPKVAIEGIEIAFHQEYGGWEFRYRGTKFLSFEPSLTLPPKAELDAILDTVESLKPEMGTRMQKGLSEWGDSNSKLDDGESYSINVQHFAADKSF